MLCKNCKTREVPAYRVKKHTYVCNECRKILYPANKQKNLEAQKRYWKKYTDLLFEHYGKECLFCGSTEDLQFDHVDGAVLDKTKNNNGRNGWAQIKWYKELVRDNYPPTCQILCKRCNYAKGRMSNEEFIAMVKEIYSRLPLP